MVKCCQTVMAIIALPLLFFHSQALAGEKDATIRKHELRAMLGGGIISPLDINEIGGSNLHRKYSWTGNLGVGYAHRIYKNLSAAVALGTHIYTYKYAANVVIDAQRVPGYNFDIRRTEKFFCFHLSVSLSQRFTLVEKQFTAEGGIRFTQTPSLYLDHGQNIQDSLGATVRIFNSEVDFNNKIVGIYFLKFGTPLFKNNSGLSVHIVYSYCPVPLGNGRFYFRNTTRNSDGTFAIKASGMGIEFRYSF